MLTSIHAGSFNSSSFLFYCSIICCFLNIPHFVDLSPVGLSLGCFQISSITYEAVMNVCVQSFVGMKAFYSLG